MILRGLERMNNYKSTWSSIVAPACLACVAAILLLWGLGKTYLWQDEAATAVLAQRMLRFGRPLAYDGVNLVTIDYFAAEDAKSAEQRSQNAQADIDYYVRRGDYKPDTTWKWHPWGQFLVAALGLKLFGATTLGARLLFALAGVATVLLFYRFVLANLLDPKLAVLASLFLLSNGYWILHSRQCRYYSLSSLFLVLTLSGYARWQRGGRWGVIAFVLAAWCWFQVDYGTVWPVFGVLFLDALIAQRQKFWKPLAVGAILAGTLAPFAYYYELWGRRSIQAGTWAERFERNIFDVNEYVVPLVVLGIAGYLWFSRRKTLQAFESRLIGVSCAIIGVFFLWIPAVAPAAFLRYTIILAPVGCLIVAWVLIRLSDSFGRYPVWIGAAIFIVTPWLSLPLRVLHPASLRHAHVVRPELKTLATSVFGNEPDPNRVVIDWLKQNSAPSDEILINYEDVPLMFYLPNPVRGGIGAFRAEDDSRRPPDFIVLRKSVDFVYWPAFERELRRYQWDPVNLHAPDIACGICPDPVQRYDAAHAPSIFVARRKKESAISQP
jgi:Dolichyl-phosphate-mannose-protein mannosyltransferase